MEEQSIWIKANCWVVYERREEERKGEEKGGEERNLNGSILQHTNSEQHIYAAIRLLILMP